MNIQALRTALLGSLEEDKLESYDGINKFCFDGSGMLRWFSPADHGSTVSFDNQEIKSHLVEKGHSIKSINGCIALSDVNLTGITFNIMAPVSVETLDYVGNKYRAAQFFIDAIEDSIDVVLKLNDVEKVNDPYLTKDNKYKQDLKITVTAGFTDKFIESYADHDSLILALSSPVKDKLGITYVTELCGIAA